MLYIELVHRILNEHCSEFLMMARNMDKHFPDLYVEKNLQQILQDWVFCRSNKNRYKIPGADAAKRIQNYEKSLNFMERYKKGDNFRARGRSRDEIIFPPKMACTTNPLDHGKTVEAWWPMCFPMSWWETGMLEMLLLNGLCIKIDKTVKFSDCKVKECCNMHEMTDEEEKEAAELSDYHKKLQQSNKKGYKKEGHTHYACLAFCKRDHSGSYNYSDGAKCHIYQDRTLFCRHLTRNNPHAHDTAFMQFLLLSFLIIIYICNIYKHLITHTNIW